MKKPKFKYWKIGEEEKLDNPSIVIHTCCDCKLRHIFTLEIKEDKCGKYISLRSYPDYEGTNVIRYIDSLSDIKKKI